jgi:Mn-dependent DtxR family transcriptional regulator
MNVSTHPNGAAPAGTRYKLGGKGGKVAQAWQYVWDRLTTEWQDGKELAAEAADTFQIAEISVLAHLHRMAAEGLVDHEKQDVIVEVTRTSKAGKRSTFPAQRTRTHYRLNRP